MLVLVNLACIPLNSFIAANTTGGVRAFNIFAVALNLVIVAAYIAK